MAGRFAGEAFPIIRAAGAKIAGWKENCGVQVTLRRSDASSGRLQSSCTLVKVNVKTDEATVIGGSRWLCAGTGDRLFVLARSVVTGVPA